MKIRSDLLTPGTCQIIFIDHQQQMVAGVRSIDRQILRNNSVLLARAAGLFDVPATITTVETDALFGEFKRLRAPWAEETGR